MIPHITDAIQEWVERVAKQSVTKDGDKPDVISCCTIIIKLQKIFLNTAELIYILLQVCIVELGGTIGDIEGMPFVEAFRQFQFRVKKENFCCAHVSLVPQVCICLCLSNSFLLS